MRENKNSAINLRKSGKSYREIGEKLSIPLSTLSEWFKNERWSENVRKILTARNIEAGREGIVRLNQIRGILLKKLYKRARKEARDEFKELKYHPLFIAGVMIYWGEGDKASKNGFRISNSDPWMIKIFLTFLKKICGGEESRIKAGLLIYPDLNVEVCENYWSRKIGLSRKNFTKSITVKGRHKTRRVQYGICTLNFSSRFLKEKMIIWMSLMAEELLKM